MMDDTKGNRPLGDFLRTRRQRLNPATLGIPATRRRRTPGLRREEVAERAGISSEWYVKLEQGRNVSPSAETIGALARALSLDAADTAHLRKLATRQASSFLPETVPEIVAAIVERLPDPAYVTGCRWDVLAWNAAADEIRRRLEEIEVEIENLSRNLLVGVVSSTLAAMLTSREEERDRLQAQLGRDVVDEVRILPHPALVRRFEEKVAGIREALNDPAGRGEAAHTIRSLIRSITIEVVEGEAVADVAASAGALIDFAQNAQNPRRSLSGGSASLVAGTGFEPVTFRL